MELIQNNRCFEGEQRIYRFHSNALQTETQFGIFLPEQALAGQACPAVFYLAGLTCNEETFAIKAHAQHMAAQLGLILISPDTSPRGEAVAKGYHLIMCRPRCLCCIDIETCTLPNIPMVAFGNSFATW